MGFLMVGMTGFEPAAFWSRTRRATKLRYIPTQKPFYRNQKIYSSPIRIRMPRDASNLAGEKTLR